MIINKELTLDDALDHIRAIYVFLVTLEADLKNFKIKSDCDHYKAGCHAGILFATSKIKTLLHVLGYDLNESIYDDSKEILKCADELLKEEKKWPMKN